MSRDVARLSRPRYVGPRRVRTTVDGRWRVVSRIVRGHVHEHRVYDCVLGTGAAICVGVFDLLEHARTEIARRIEGERSRLAVFRDQDRYFVPRYDRDAWAELERRGLVTLHEDADGDTYAERVPAERSGAAE